MRKLWLCFFIITAFCAVVSGCSSNEESGNGSGGDGNIPVNPEDSEIINATIRVVSDEENRLRNVFFSPATATNGSDIHYSWDFGDGKTLNTDVNIVEHTFLKYGKDYDVVLALKNLKNNNITKANITVSLPAPELSFTHQVQGLDIYVTPVLTGAQINDMKYTWDFGDGTEKVESTGQEIVSHKYLSSGKKIITLTGISPKLSKEIVTSLEINISNRIELGNIEVDNISQDKLEYTFSITGNIKENDSKDELEYRWIFGDGKTSEWHKANNGKEDNVTHRYDMYKDSYNVQVEARINNADYSTTNKVVKIELPTLTIGNSGNGLEQNFTAQSSYQLAGNVSYIWDFGDKTQSAGREVSHTYKKGGAYQVSVSMTSDKLNNQYIKVQKEIKITNDIQDIDIVYNVDKANPLKYKFVTNAKALTGKKLVYEWLIDGKTYTTKEVDHTFGMYGENYNIVLKVSLEGSSEKYEAPKTFVTTIKPKISINDFNYNVITDKENTFTLEEYLNNQKVNVLVNPTYKWNFGDGSKDITGASPKHTYSKAGMYDVEVEVSAENLKGTLKDIKTIGVLQSDNVIIKDFKAECPSVNETDIIKRKCTATATIENLDNPDILEVVWVDTTGTESVKVSKLSQPVEMIFDWPLAIANRNSQKNFKVTVDVRVSGSSKPLYSKDININIANYVDYTLFPYDKSGIADFGTGPYIKLEDTGYGIGGRDDSEIIFKNAGAGKTLNLGPLTNKSIQYKWGYEIKRNDGKTYSGIIKTDKIDFDIIDMTNILETSKFTGYIYDINNADKSVEYSVFYLELFDPEKKLLSKPLRVYYNGNPDKNNALTFISPRIETSKVECGYDVTLTETTTSDPINYRYWVEANKFQVPIMDSSWIDANGSHSLCMNLDMPRSILFGCGWYYNNGNSKVENGMIQDLTSLLITTIEGPEYLYASKVELQIGTQNKSYVTGSTQYYSFFRHTNGHNGKIRCKIDDYSPKR